jgi:hypothetical protein
MYIYTYEQKWISDQPTYQNFSNARKKYKLQQGRKEGRGSLGNSADGR